MKTELSKHQIGLIGKGKVNVMKKNILLTTILAVILAACGSKAESIQVTTATETETAGIEMSGKDFDTGDIILSKDENANNPQEKEVNEELEATPEIVADNATGLTSQIVGPPYLYEVNGVNFELDINIYEYIYEQNGKMFFDAEKMGNDAGFTTSHEFQNRWDNIYLLEVPDGGSLYIKLGASPNNKERIDNHEVIGLINVCYMPNFPNSMETDGTVRVIKNNLNDDHYMITGIGSLIDIDMAKALAYIIDVSSRTPSNIGDNLVEPLSLNKDGSFFVFP